MINPLLISAGVAFLTGFPIFLLGIRLAYRFKILDMPTSRRRHAKPMPIVGGVCVLSALVIGLLSFTLLEPSWISFHLKSILALGTSLSILLVLGLIDDIKGLGPYSKLFFQCLAAGVMLAFEPQIHALCEHWEGVMGPSIWALAVLWIVGITNAVNLIDGLDGLAGGTILLTACSILILSIWTGPEATFGTVAMALLIPAVVCFLCFNWNPSKVFLGDNGSLPLGFLLANASLMCRPQSKSWIMMASVVLMLGYPILDTSLAVLRRLRKGLPIFKADRNHLHYRILRLGFSVRQVAGLLLSITFYLQVAALCINLMDPASGALGLVVVGFSIFSLLFLVRGIERWRVIRLFSAFKRDQGSQESHVTSRLHLVMNIDLEPLLEAGMAEEKGRYHQLLAALQLLIRSTMRKDDLILMTDQRLSILFTDFEGNEEMEAAIIDRIRKKIDEFLNLYNLQCSLSGLPISLEKRTLIHADTPPKRTSGPGSRESA